MNKFLHIVCLDAPAPPDYGGAIDMFYKIKALHETGIKVILHYFDYNPSRNAKEAGKYCAATFAYKREAAFHSLPITSPLIVNSRINRELIDRLNKDDYPVLLEGLHCSGIVPFLQNKGRVVVRMHNEEASYYHHLAHTERSFLKRLYFLQESRLLKQYQHNFDKEIKLACLSETDMQLLEKNYGFHHLAFIPCFIPWQHIASSDGQGEFCLYHGNLSVPENERAACWLIDHIFSKVEVPLVVAGKGISKTLIAKGKNFSNIRLVNNPSIAEIDNLVREAHINVLPSLNATGVKLKLLNALLNGRYCITNSNGVMGSRIQKGVTVKDSPDQWIEAIKAITQRNFSSAERKEREDVLTVYDNRSNALKLSELWSHCQ